MTAPRTPQDHLKPAAQIEAEGSPTVDVTWRDLTLTVPSDPDDWSVVAMLAFEDGKNANGLRVVLGADQWAKVMKLDPTRRDLNDIFDIIAKDLGMGSAGE